MRIAEEAKETAESAASDASEAKETAKSAANTANHAQGIAEPQEAASLAQSIAEGAVRFDEEQDLDEDEQTQARVNIGAAASDNASLTGTTTAESIEAETVTASEGFTGDLEGTASKATADADGNVITETYATKADTYTKTEVDAKVSSVYRFRGSVDSYDDLPTADLTVGDVYNILDTGANYAWTDDGWDRLSETVDLTPYLTKDDAADTYVPLAGGTMTGALILNANPTADLGAATKQYVDSEISDAIASSGTVPTGTVILFATTSAPSGFLRCNGSAVSRTTYADLFSVIGTTYGSGDGSTTFNLPSIATTYLMSGNVPVIGNGMALGLTNGSVNVGLNTGTSGSDILLAANASSYGAAVSTSTNGRGPAGIYGVTTNPNYSGLVTSMTSQVAMYCFIKY